MGTTADKMRNKITLVFSVLLSDFRYCVASKKTPSPGATSYTLYQPRKVATRAVKRGEYLGLSGNSGSAQGKHLHVEYYTNHNAVFGTSAAATTWVYASQYDNVVKDPKNYMKLWWVAPAKAREADLG